MIKTRRDLKRYLETEKKIYVESDKKKYFEQVITCDPKLTVYKFLKILRKEAYHHNNSGIYHKLMYAYWRRKRNKLGLKIGIEMWDNTFDEGLSIEHAGNIVINGHAKVGKNCILHGSNCIGNNGLVSDCPVIGDNVRIGVGARIIGGVRLADGIKVAAGAIVVHSFDEEGITVAGIPARKVSKGDNYGKEA